MKAYNTVFDVEKEDIGPLNTYLGGVIS